MSTHVARRENVNIQPIRSTIYVTEDDSYSPNKFKRVGKDFVEIAERFVKVFPIGSEFTAEDFDNWAENEEDDKGNPLLPTECPEGIESDSWKKHLSERAIAREKVNKGGASDHLREDIGKFQLHIDRRTLVYSVKSVEDSFLQRGSDAAKEIGKLYETKAERVNRLIHSTDFEMLSKEAQNNARTLQKTLLRFSENITMQIRYTNEDVRQLHESIVAERAALPEGATTNGGFKAIEDLADDSADWYED